MGQGQERDATVSAAFKAWFGDSKVVYANGEPMIVYHGATNDFEPEAGRKTWFVSDPAIASAYAEIRSGHRQDKGESAAASVRPAYLCIQNPLVIDAEGAEYDVIAFEGDVYETDQLADIAQSRGHDGLIVMNLDDTGGVTDEGKPSSVYAVFDPTQIQSIFNCYNDPRVYTETELQAMETEVLDRMAFGVACGDVVELPPDQIEIQYQCDLENPEHKFAKGGMAWAQSVDLSEPVEIEVKQDGKFYLADGHHRWFAAGKTGRTLKAVVEVKANPVTAILRRQDAGGSPSPVCASTKNAAFSEWFRDSLAVDRDGNPLVVYHGTRRKFSRFSEDLISGSSANEFGRGFYFTPSREMASLYAGRPDDGRLGEPNVIPAYLSIRNPKFVSTADRGGATGWHGEYDGLIVVYSDAEDTQDPSNWAEVVVARAEQIKFCASGPSVSDELSDDLVSNGPRF